MNNTLVRALPTVRYQPQHMAALGWENPPSFITALSEREGTSARSLEYLILTTVRSGEARKAHWSEINGDLDLADLFDCHTGRET